MLSLEYLWFLPPLSTLHLDFFDFRGLILLSVNILKSDVSQTHSGVRNDVMSISGRHVSSRVVVS